jgi:23S rRNA pseudouridine1911/1915/1917 synthase
MEILYCDNHLLIVNKPNGMPTQSSREHADNLTDRAKEWIKKRFNKPGNVFLEPIHRLDKPVSGLVLFARTSKALSRLQEMMRERKIQKKYYALVDHMPPSSQGVLEHYLVHGEHQAQVVSEKHPEGKRAILTYQVLRKAQQGFLLEITLETGRYHQIRAQFAHIRLPIIGDRKYGSSTSWEREEIALHHGKLSFCHPVTQKEMVFTSSASFRDVL